MLIRVKSDKLTGTIQRQTYREAAEAALHQETALVHWGPVPDPLKLLNARLGRWGRTWYY